MTNKFPQESFNLREARGEDFCKVMMVNEALKGYEFKNEFSWFLHFDIDMKEVKQPFKLPTEKEAEILNSLEDRITSIIQDTVPYQFIGRITDNGHRELYFYVESPKEIHKKLSDLIEQGNPVREFEYSIAEDESWEKVDFFFDY
jgi:predicted transcriptional regulator